jgi:hypothetical protein
MKAEVNLDFKTYLKLNYQLTYKKPLIIIIYIFGTLMFIGSVAYFIGLRFPGIEPPYFHLLFSIGILVSFPLIIYRASKRNYYSNARLQEKIIYEFSDDRIYINGESFSADMDWEKIHSVEILKKWILIYQSKVTAHILPKSTFGNELGDFYKILQKNAVKMR